MNRLLDRLFAAAYDPFLRSAERAGLARLRSELLGDLEGHVVELGAGTGANLDHLGPGVERLTALEPAPAMAARLRDRVARTSGRSIEVLEAPAEAVPLPASSADTVVSTLVLCTVEDPQQALAEIHRVLRPGGQLVLIEHVRGTGTLARVQRVLEPAWRVVGRGCHLTRDTRSMLEGAGFDVSGLRDTELPMPVPTKPGLVGVATT